MDFRYYLFLFRRWWWLMLLLGFIGGSYFYVTRSNQRPIYRSTAMISIGTVISSPNPDWNAIQSSRQLVQTYEQIVRTFDVAQRTVDALDLALPPEVVRGMISTQDIEGTSLMRINVTYGDPVLTADIANELAQQLIEISPGLTSDQVARAEFLEEEIAVAQTELNAVRTELDLVQAQLDDGEDLTQEERASLQQQRTILRNNAAQIQGNIGSFERTLQGYREQANRIELREAARIGGRINSSGSFSSTIIGVVAGIGVAVAIVIALEYLNNTYRSSDELMADMPDRPVLGVISRYGSKNASYQSRLITQLDLMSPTIEQYRTLRTNLNVHMQRSGQAVFLVTSATPSEGKSVTVSNLATSLAINGRRVLLIDADLRKPRLHEAFQVEQKPGLTEMLKAYADITEMQQDIGNSAQWKQYLRSVPGIPNLTVIPSGFIPRNPSEVLGSPLMKRWVKAFLMSGMFDIILFDTPPALAISDSTVLSSSVDANVILVIEAGRARKPMVRKTIERFIQVDVDVVGFVLNNANIQRESYYGYYTDSYYYYTDHNRRRDRGARDKAPTQVGAE